MGELIPRIQLTAEEEHDLRYALIPKACCELGEAEEDLEECLKTVTAQIHPVSNLTPVSVTPARLSHRRDLPKDCLEVLFVGFEDAQTNPQGAATSVQRTTKVRHLLNFHPLNRATLEKVFERRVPKRYIMTADEEVLAELPALVSTWSVIYAKPCNACQ